ncbi:MAG: four helix bundle protein [Candidatus Omnitrophota bacterium]
MGGVGIKNVGDLKVYQLSYELAMVIFGVTANFPKEEKYSLIDQMRRSSRSVAINIREGYAKRKYGRVFVRHINDALGSSEETRGWLKFSVDCGYIQKEEFLAIDKQYGELGAMLFSLMKNWKTYSNET